MTPKQISLLFLDYYLKTARFSFESSGENIGLSYSKIFDKFIKLTMKQKPRYKNKDAQRTFENALKWTYPIDWEKHKIGGSLKAAWENGYLGKEGGTARHARGSTAWVLYYAGKEVRRLENKK